MTGVDRHVRGHIGSCPATGKRAYLTRRAAKRAIRDLDSSMHPYPCDHCGFWHMGHLPKAVRSGRLTRSDYYERQTT